MLTCLNGPIPNLFVRLLFIVKAFPMKKKILDESAHKVGQYHGRDRRARKGIMTISYIYISIIRFSV